MAFPQITFGMIVLNGEPFVRYNLRALYPFAHEIIVVEGAVPGAASISTPNGHSKDRTLTDLWDFKKSEDSGNKLVIVTAEDEGHPNGFWAGEKDEQSRAYAGRASGEYLWQVDADEFYMPGDILKVINILQKDPNITAVSFKMFTFWGGFNTVTDGWYLRRGASEYHRLFRWGAGYSYQTHRPPTVIDANGRNLRDKNWLRADTLIREGVFLYHYSLVFPKQVLDKCEYYESVDWVRRSDAVKWAKENYLRLGNPFRVHNVYDFPSWLETYRGIHPPQIEKLRQDIHLGRLKVAVRPINDIDHLLKSPIYKVGIIAVKNLDYLFRFKDFVIFAIRRIYRLISKTLSDFHH